MAFEDIAALEVGHSFAVDVGEVPGDDELKASGLAAKNGLSSPYGIGVFAFDGSSELCPRVGFDGTEDFIANNSDTDGAEVFLLRKGRLIHLVGKDNVVDSDIAPGSGDGVNNFDGAGNALEVVHIPDGKRHLVAVFAGGGADDFAADKEVDARLVGVVSSTNKESDEVALDFERWAG